MTFHTSTPKSITQRTPADSPSLRILQVAPDCPYPPNNGQRVGVWNRTLALAKLGHQVDLVATTRRPLEVEQAKVMQSVTRRMWTVERFPNWRGILSRQPGQLATRSRLSRTVLKDDYDLVLIEGEACSSILDNPQLSAKRVAIRIHNDEIKFFREQASSEHDVLRRAYFEVEASRYKKKLQAIHARADHLWFVSYDEWLEWSRANSASKEKGCWLPPAIQIARMRRNNSDSKRVLFLGTLAFPTNIQAVEWYYVNVHKNLLDVADYQFVVAGNTLGRPVAPIFQQIENDPRCQLLRDVPDVDPLFDSCSVFVSPIQRGAGVKMKVLSAAEAGLPVVSTSKGCEGTGLNHKRDILVSNEASEFASHIRLLLGNKILRQSLANASQIHLTENYDHEKCLGSLFANC